MAAKGVLFKKFEYESNLWDKGLERVAGVDEVGRGPLAGPVVAGAVILANEVPVELPVVINDSKKLSANQRLAAYEWITESAISWGIGIVSVSDIDKLNIRTASFLAMQRAIENMPVAPQHILVDGLPMDDPPYNQTAIIKGDSLSISIAAASIIAKIVRDEIMATYYNQKFPDYNFAAHKGYATKTHIEAIREHGRCAIHRRSFKLKDEKQRDLFL
ncbi:MAG: ribonuclease HII [Deferribacteres bacterium]|nr:ribonuclease HII [candidate division KSB1 bacterium]MCB9501254.1 ribonuclease HII [Deferribacteres bacterium]